jgi:hypothetical protein
MLGGAGNPVGAANPAGIGTTLNYIGKFCYAYSGQIATTSSDDMTLLQFETGSELLRVQLSMVTYGVTSEDFRYKISFNSQQINEVYFVDTFDSYTEDSRNFFYIIPPYTKVLITGNSVGGGSGNIGAMLAGEIHA